MKATHDDNQYKTMTFIQKTKIDITTEEESLRQLPDKRDSINARLKK